MSKQLNIKITAFPICVELPHILNYPKFQTASGKFKRLSWSHFCELIPIDNQEEIRNLIETQLNKENDDNE